MNEFTERTAAALGSNLLEKLESSQFCVVGCGGTGGNFAEMLVRTGATKVDLIDGMDVKQSGLNRVFAYSRSDCGEKKTTALSRRLHAIRPDLSIREYPTHFRTPEQSMGNLSLESDVCCAVATAVVVFVAVDQRDSRRAVEEFCREERDGNYLSCGVHIDPGDDIFEFECNWQPKSPKKEDDQHDGYGPENASFGSIVVEAASVAFTMLLSHLRDPNSDFVNYTKRYDGAFRPIQ